VARNLQCFPTCSQKVADISDKIVLKIKTTSSPGFLTPDHQRSNVMRSKIMALAWSAAFAGAAVLATGTSATAYRWHRYRAPVVGMAAGSLIAAGIAEKERWSPPGYEGEYLYGGYAGSVYDPWYYGAAEPRYPRGSVAVAYVNAPYAYCLRRFGTRRYCR
jgi:hypothetical protein